MKKYLLFFYFVFFAHFLFAQNNNDADYTELYNTYTFTNPNGVREFLRQRLDNGKNNPFYYSSTVYPKEVELKTQAAILGKYKIRVSFPNETKIYVLEPGLFELLCTNPDGSKQEFKHSGRVGSLGTFKSIDKNGIAEFLELQQTASGYKAYYYTSANDKKRELILTNPMTAGKCFGELENFDVQFPNEKTIYKAIFDYSVTLKNQKPLLLCTNTTTNATQKFEWIRK